MIIRREIGFIAQLDNFYPPICSAEVCSGSELPMVCPCNDANKWPHFRQNRTTYRCCVWLGSLKETTQYSGEGCSLRVPWKTSQEVHVGFPKSSVGQELCSTKEPCWTTRSCVFLALRSVLHKHGQIAYHCFFGWFKWKMFPLISIRGVWIAICQGRGKFFEAFVPLRRVFD